MLEGSGRLPGRQSSSVKVVRRHDPLCGVSLLFEARRERRVLLLRHMSSEDALDHSRGLLDLSQLLHVPSILGHPSRSLHRWVLLFFVVVFVVVFQCAKAKRVERKVCVRRWRPRTHLKHDGARDGAVARGEEEFALATGKLRDGATHDLRADPFHGRLDGTKHAERVCDRRGRFVGQHDQQSRASVLPVPAGREVDDARREGRWVCVRERERGVESKAGSERQLKR